ncbi:hypothetical protein E0W72_07620 [Flavobacterium arcticum]|nr:hypothetical protein [Flavobacterium arcticum]KAF2510342.1 hypothetical protein E0W72_07620 [Flavobacterium arcticum]
MNIHKSILLFSFMTASVFTAQAQEKPRSITALSDKEIQALRDRKSIQFEASEYTENYPVLGITIMRDTVNEKAFYIFKEALSKKLTEKGIPHKYFIEVLNDDKGAAFAYFIKGRQHGIFTFDEFIALLPEAVRDYRRVFPKHPSEVQP